MIDQPIDAVALLEKRRPLFHASTGGERSLSWGISPEVLRWLQSHALPGMTTLETGSGDSTVVFLSRVRRHIAVAPDDGEGQAIRDFCQSNAIDTSGLDFQCGLSQVVLPGLAPELQLDIVLIDGDHAFPAPFIDWYYVADKVRKGGWVLVDDTQLRTGRVLRQFLKSEEEWTLVCDIGKTAVFVKNVDGPVTHKGWGEQPWGASPYPVADSGLDMWMHHLRNTVRVRSRLRALPDDVQAWQRRRQATRN